MLTPTTPFIREILTLIRGFTFWRKSPAPSPNCLAFSYVEENTDVMLLKALIIYFTLELTAGHALLIFLAPAAAWPVFWLGVLNLVYLIGVINTWHDNPVLLNDSRLKIRSGLKHHMDIDLSNIAAVEPASLTRIEAKQAGQKILSYLAEPNVTVHLKEGLQTKTVLHGSIQVNTIALVLDKPGKFVQEIRNKLPSRPVEAS